MHFPTLPLAFGLPVALACLLTTLATAQQGPRLLGAQSLASAGGPATLVEIDAATASTLQLGLIGFQVDAMASGPDGTLYVANNTMRELVTIDALTGAVLNVVGSLGNRSLEGLAAHPVTGELWGVSYPGSMIVRIDATTGAVSELPNSALDNGAGMSWSMDGSVLYGMNFSSGGLYEIDPITGLGILIGTGSGGQTGGPLGLATHPTTGELYVAEWRSGADMTLSIVSPIDGQRTPIGTMPGATSIEGLTFVEATNIGVNYCGPAVPNSSGSGATLRATGSQVVAANDVELIAEHLPSQTLGLFLTSPMQAFVSNPAGSSGNLCLGGTMGRYLGPGQVQHSGSAGQLSLSIDLTMTPRLMGTVAIQAGETWNFQAWFRDAAAGMATSNFTDGLSVGFL